MNKVYIASLIKKGPWAEPIDETSQKVNVTSAQRKTNKNRLDFCPLTAIEGKYKGYYCFENYWQAGKMYKDADNEAIKKIWKDLNIPRREFNELKDKTVLCRMYEGYNEKMSYIKARKKVYVPEYYELIKDKEMIQFWRDKLQTRSLTIYDYDGPKNEDGTITCLELTKELLIEKINDPTHVFGHGYIVAATIANIHPSEYI